MLWLSFGSDSPRDAGICCQGPVNFNAIPFAEDLVSWHELTENPRGISLNIDFLKTLENARLEDCLFQCAALLNR